MSDIVATKIADGSEAVRYGNVGSVEYRDSVDGVRFTAHWSVVAGYGWIVEHAPTDRADTDGEPVKWSGALPNGWEGLNDAWHDVRNGK